MNGSIFVVEDEYLMRWSLKKELTKEGYFVNAFETGEEAIERAEDEFPEIILLDLCLPKMDGFEVLKRLKKMKNSSVQVIVITAKDDVKAAVRSIKLGAYDYLTKPVDFKELKQVLKRALETLNLRKEVNHFRGLERKQYDIRNIIGQSGAMREVFDMARKIAESDTTTVLLTGESGTGKNLIAHFIHYHSKRRNRPFVEINCAAVPETLLETELMGHERGAFTDAKKKKIGLLEQANGGTIFLDEISDMRLDLQGKILNLLETKRFRRVGGLKDIEVDTRIIAATNKDLKGAIQEGRFREDLYYRLGVFPIYIPPLRERGSDIPLMIKFFIEKFNREFNKEIKGLSQEAERYLRDYYWPGNCRELKNVIERAMILEEEDVIGVNRLPREIIVNTESNRGNGRVSIKIPPMGLELKEVEIEILKQALDSAEGNQVQAAKLLGISRDTLRYRMKKFGLLKSQ